MYAATPHADFGARRDDLVRMVPPGVPYSRGVVGATGGLNLLGTLGLLVPGAQSLAGAGLAALLSALFPANLRAARRRIAPGGKPAAPLWFRMLVWAGASALTPRSSRPQGTAAVSRLPTEDCAREVVTER